MPRRLAFTSPPARHNITPNDANQASWVTAAGHVGLRLLLNREHELSQLCRALDGALRGRGQIVLTAGEARIGKTTLAQRSPHN